MPEPAVTSQETDTNADSTAQTPENTDFTGAEKSVSVSVATFPADTLRGAVEAALLCADKTLGIGRITDLVRAAYTLPNEAVDNTAVQDALDALNTDYEKTGRAFRIEKVAGGVRMMTLPAFAPVVAALQGAAKEAKLSRAALETLSIVAYRQPITRAELEAIRGVACGEVLRSLLDKRLVAIDGRADEPGRPILYATTRQFLEIFGLPSLKDLPAVDAPQLKPLVEKKQAKEIPTETNSVEKAAAEPSDTQ